MNEAEFDKLPRETLVKLLKVYARLFLALDGFWFLAAKEKLGYDVALDLDTKAWEGYFPYEAKKIRDCLGITDDSVEGILDSVKYSAFVPCLKHVISAYAKHKGVFEIWECPSLAAMERGGYAPTCEPVGTIVFNAYAKAINPKVAVRFLDGPPRKSPRDVSCKWEFVLEDGKDAPAPGR